MMQGIAEDVPGDILQGIAEGDAGDYRGYIAGDCKDVPGDILQGLQRVMQEITEEVAGISRMFQGIKGNDAGADPVNDMAGNVRPHSSP